MASPDIESSGGLSLHEVLKALRRRWVIVAICVVVTPAVALAISLNQVKEYTATATLLFQKTNAADDLIGRVDYSIDQDRIAATNTALASLSTVRDRTRAALADRVPDASVNVAVSQSGSDDLATVEAVDPDPRVATLTATKFAEEFVEFRRESQSASIDRGLTLLNRRLARLEQNGASPAEIEKLRGQQQDLANLAALQTGNVQLVERAKVPEVPSSPRTRRNVVLGIVLGGLLGIALALLIDRFDRRIRDADEIEDSVDAPVLGIVPQSKAIQKQKGGLETLRPSDIEAFRLLRAELRYFEASKDASCVLVTSSSPGEGKSTVAWNLALCAAESGARTLLVEADLRRPVLALKMGTAPGEKGLSTVLSEQVTLSQALQHYEHGGEDEHTFDVLYAGPKPPNPADLIESENMTSLLGEVRRRYDFIVIDSAPVPVVADPIPLLSQVDGVLVVTRLGQTKRDELSHLRRQLAKFKAPVLGVVINGGDRVSDYAGYANYIRPDKGEEGAPQQALARTEKHEDDALPPITANGASNGAGDAADYVRDQAKSKTDPDEDAVETADS
ncbi:MAG: polysaccharide biosynthesis tyrosine autokinase [Solirubrobacteraceae bacterium]|nr:polysaccharide biosynthesis tyrosine autokinase [Solirubrobacteraceae bacterium]